MRSVRSLDLDSFVNPDLLATLHLLKNASRRKTTREFQDVYTLVGRTHRGYGGVALCHGTFKTHAFKISLHVNEFIAITNDARALPFDTLPTRAVGKMLLSFSFSDIIKIHQYQCY
eukprot:m.587 g.587  ORF g.587 m.587 type:complete len:116 (-) comp265_c0_seq2:278-625(-)